MEIIESKDNKLIKDIKKLKERKFRDKQGEFFIEGYRFVEEAFKAGVKINKLIISQSFVERFNNSLLESCTASRHIVKDNIFQDICSTETPQGVGAVVSKDEAHFTREPGVYVLIDRIQDQGNFGTIIRTSHAAGVKGIIYTNGTVDPYNDKSLRSTMGSVFYIPIVEDKNFTLINEMKAEGYKLIVSSLDTEENFYDIKYGEKIIIAVGNEGRGISDEVSHLADIKVKIPMPGGAESLNASVAASIMIYEVLRQKLNKS